MPKDQVDRRLAAIFAGDIAGYSRLMGADEEGTLRQLKAHRKELVDPKITEHRGRIVKTTGDGILVEFVSVVDAVRCAVDIQRGMAERNAGVQPDERIEFRIGINVGDIIFDGDDIFGDGVNVAARLEALADPGGIMVSGVVHDQVRDKLSFNFEDLGEQAVKNVIRPVGVHRVHLAEQVARGKSAIAAGKMERTASDRPSLAVLPFVNMSGDTEQEYFADGITEDIITALSKLRWFFVIARNSSFIYKGKAVDVKRVARELGVRYVLEGSVRKSGNRVRITAQLIDAATGNHIWAEHYDGELNDIFDLQDKVTTRVVGAIAPKLEQVEIERAKRKPTESLDAYDHYLRGMASLHQWTSESSNEALRLFYKTFELDPGFASAYGMAAWCFVVRKANRWMAADPAQEIAEAARLARRAVDLGADDATALSVAGYALVFVAHDLDNGSAILDRALSLNPNHAGALINSGWTKAFLGEPDTAIKHVTDAMRLSPLDPMSFRTRGAVALAHFVAGRYDEASLWAEKALGERANFLPAIRELAASRALAGRSGEAQAAMTRLREIAPAMRVSTVKEWQPFRRPDDLARLEDGLRKAGLPE
jgi:adenylate cyclase